MPAFVFINGEQVELLEDRRVSLYPRFPPGTTLMDPSTIPAKPVPLSTDAEEAKFGFTARKLLPFAHYHAFLPLPEEGSLTVKEERRPANVPLRVLIIQNLPSQALPEYIGKMFEQINFVEEADTVKDRSGPHDHTLFCRGRGYIRFKDPKKVEQILRDYGRTWDVPNHPVPLTLDSSDVLPKGCNVPPPQYGGAIPPPPPTTTNTTPSPSSFEQRSHPQGPSPPSSATGHHHHMHHHHHHHNSMNALSTAAPSTVRTGGPTVGVVAPRSQAMNASNPISPHHHHHHHIAHHHHHHHHASHNVGGSSSYYFTIPMSAEAANNSVNSREIWIACNAQRRVADALEAIHKSGTNGSVHVIVIVQSLRSVFGYGTITAVGGNVGAGAKGSAKASLIDWRKSSVYVSEEELKQVGYVPVNFAQLGEDLAVLDAEVGARVCEMLDRHAPRAKPQSQGPLAPPPPAGGGSAVSSPTTSRPPPVPRSMATSSSSYAGQPIGGSGPMMGAPPPMMHHHHQMHHHHHHHNPNGPMMGGSGRGGGSYLGPPPPPMHNNGGRGGGYHNNAPPPPLGR